MVECYVDDKELQDKANLVICAGSFSQTQKLSVSQLEIYNRVHKLIEYSHTKGKICLLDAVSYESEVPELYRVVGSKGGIFVDCDITDPLPLTVIEAALSGVPVVANNTCALLNIISKGKSELLINVKKHNFLSEAILKLLNNKNLWEHCSMAGVDCILNELTWDIMAQKVFNVYEDVINQYSVKT
jgi:sucrose-phosphate synthase